MSFHHYRRLSEHWPDNSKKLNPSATLVALTIANHLNTDTGRWAISGNTISKWANGLSISTIRRAVRLLESLEFFEVSRAKQRQPKEFRLLISCPEGCERLQDHNTPNELKALAKVSKTSPAQSVQPDTSKANGVQPDTSRVFNLTDSVELDESTNRELIEINKKDDIENSFEFIFIWETLAALKGANELRADHALLIEALQRDTLGVMERARAITAKAQEPKSYLRGAIMKHPESLINRPKRDPKSEYKPLISESRIRTKWDSILIFSPEIIEFDKLSTSSRKFLQNVAKESETLTITSAKLASKATRLGFDISSARSVSEASAIVSETINLVNESI